MGAPPVAPSALVAVSDVNSVDLSWTASPSADILGAVVTYDVYQSTTSGTEFVNTQALKTAYASCAALASSVAQCSDLVPVPVASGLTGTSTTVSGLTNGTLYYFVVVAWENGSPSFPSNETSSIPALRVPTPPLNVQGVAGNASATVTWTAPASNGGSPITGYTVTSSHGDVISVGPSTYTAHFTGLTNWTPYTFSVAATNAVGTSSGGIPSGVVTPEGTPGRPTISAVSEPDPVSGQPVVAITVTANITSADSNATLTATVLRNDGTYVLGASPLFPVSIPMATPTVTIYDRQAPYGQFVSYTANVTFSSTGQPYTTPPSIPSTPVQMGDAPDTVTLWSRMGYPADVDVNGQLKGWLSGPGQMLQALDSLCTDSYDLTGTVAPGWSQVLDINRCPTAALPWLGQFVGVEVDQTLRDDQQRWQILHPTGWSRGTLASIKAAANQYLAPGFSVTVNERDTSPYHLTIDVPTSAFRGDTTCLGISQEFATCLALSQAFATCAQVWNTTVTGSPTGVETCLIIADTYATCADFAAAFTNCAAVWQVDHFIADAIASMLPAGLDVTVTYV